MRAVFLPQFEMYHGNPYWLLLKQSLESEGVEFLSTEDPMYLQWRWLYKNRRKVDVIHMHFIQHHYAISEEKGSFIALSKYLAKLVWARILGYKVIWTLHNLLPHEPVKPFGIDRIAHFVTAQLSSSVIVHCENARHSLAKTYFRRRQVVTAAHPNYINAYPNNIDRTEARDRLGLSSRMKVYLFLGAIRPYKGLENLIESFRQIQGDNLVLMIVGKIWNSKFEQKLNELIHGDCRIRIVPKYVPDTELQVFLNAADAVVLPFSNVLSSGSILLAMSFGRPVIAPALGCVPETVVEDTGILYSPEDSQGLLLAIQKSIDIDLSDLGKKAEERAKCLDWENMAKRIIQAYSL